MSDELEPERLKLLRHIDQLVHYWLTVENPPPCQRYPWSERASRMDGLVYSILLMIDGGSDQGPYTLRLLRDGEEGPDLSDHELHSRWARGVHR